MRNLPDDELFDALETRLRNFMEEPGEEVWNKISAEIPRSRTPLLMLWFNRSAAVLAIVTLLFLPGVKTDRPVSNSTNEFTKDTRVPSGKVPPELVLTPGRGNRIVGRADASVAHLEARGNKPTSFDVTDTPFIPVNHREDTLAEAQPVTHSDSVEVEVAILPLPLAVPDSIELTDTREPGEKKKKKRKGISFYSLVTPTLSYYRISPLAEDHIVIERLKSPPVLSAGRLGISIEAGIQGKITSRLEYLAGITYYSQSQRIKYEQLTSDHVIIEEEDGKGYMVRPGVLEKSFQYKMQNIGAQAGLMYSLKQVGLVHKAGILLQYQKGFHTPDETSGFSRTRPDYLSYQLLYRMEYAVRRGVFVFVQPSYSRSFYSDESLQAPFSLKQSRAGIGLGIVYLF